jgi:hypothetical protein
MSDTAKQRMFGIVEERDALLKRAMDLRRSKAQLRRDLKRLSAQAKDLTPEQVVQFNLWRRQQAETGTELNRCNRRCNTLLDDLLALVRDIRDGGLLF